jgi:hypothetical protein
MYDCPYESWWLDMLNHGTMFHCLLTVQNLLEEDSVSDLLFALVAMKKIFVSSQTFLIITDKSNIRLA